MTLTLLTVQGRQGHLRGEMRESRVNSVLNNMDYELEKISRHTFKACI